MHRIWNFVITGGPCSGKTTGLKKLESYFSEKDFKVIIVSETATIVINSGISFKETPVDIFQKSIFDIGMIREESTRKASECIAEYLNKDVIIFYDRGLMDGKAYMSSEGFDNLLKDEGFTEKEIKNRYDAVFHLVTAADGAEEFYTLDNNEARTETPEEARELDKKTYNAWVGHEKLYRFDNSTDFETKIKRLIEKVELEVENIR